METRLVGWLLVAGTLVFLVGAVGWKPWQFDLPLDRSLPHIAAQPFLWRWINGWIAAGVAVTAAALCTVPGLLGASSQRVLAPFAAGLYGLGAAAMIISMAFRVTVQAAAAADTVATGQVPTTFLAFHAWAGALFGVHMVLSHLGSIALGIALWPSDLVARWFGPAAIAVGGVLGLGYVSLGGLFSMPILAHVVTFTLGILLIRH